MEYLSADKILVVDLASSEVNEDELSEELVEEKIGGAAVAKTLCEEHADGDPVVVSTGLLTGTLYPGTAAAMITAKHPVTGKICHCPVTLKVGLEIQYAGFDYIVIKGKAAAPSFLWVHDGIADISDAADVWGKDVWETTETWRKAMGDDLIQTLVIGKAGENLSDFAQICCNFWASGDQLGFGKLFGAKNLKGMAFRGMGLLEIADAEEFIELSLDMLEDLKESDYVGRQGIGDICSAMGEANVGEWLSPLVHRHSACYNTPYPTNTFAFIDEDPKKMEEPDQGEPGVLLTEPFGLIGFHKLGLSPKEACSLIKACAKLGIDAAAVAEASKAAGLASAPEIENALLTLSGETAIAGGGFFSPCCPRQPIFGDFEDSGDDASAWWERRMAVAYIFGIHPMFAIMAPELTEDELIETAAVGTEIEFSQETLDKAVEYLLQ